MKQDPNISKSFEKDIYNSFVWNYAMLHNYMEESDVIDINRESRKKELDMPGIRRLLEEIVAGTDIPDNNLRKLVDTELRSIQARRKQERAAAEKVTKRQKKNIKTNAKDTKGQQE